MTNCWSKGDLRAYCDGELGESSAADAEAHLHTCAACAAGYEEVRAKARYVGGLMAELRESTFTPKLPDNRPERRRRVTTAAVALSGAIAAGLALFLFWPDSTPRQPEPSPVFSAKTSAATPVAALPIHKTALRTHTPRHAARKNPPVVSDDDTIQAAYILRVALGPQEAPADVIVTPDGRIRAVRLLQQDRP